MDEAALQFRVQVTRRHPQPSGTLLSRRPSAVEQIRVLDVPGHRPDELIAQTIVTADLLDWLRAITVARLLDRTGTPGHLRDEQKPQTLKRRTTMGTSFRIDLAAVPPAPEEAAAIIARIQSEAEDPKDADDPRTTRAAGSSRAARTRSREEITALVRHEYRKLRQRSATNALA